MFEIWKKSDVITLRESSTRSTEARGSDCGEEDVGEGGQRSRHLVGALTTIPPRTVRIV